MILVDFVKSKSISSRKSSAVLEDSLSKADSEMEEENGYDNQAQHEQPKENGTKSVESVAVESDEEDRIKEGISSIRFENSKSSVISAEEALKKEAQAKYDTEHLSR